MKNCTKCKEDIDIEGFPIINKKTGKRSSMCLPCKREYDRNYYQNNTNKETKLRKQKERISVNKLKFVSLLKTKECIDCGNDNILCLEFDHLRDKEFNVGNMVNKGMSWSKILLETEKCEVRCANCHRIKTSKDQNWFKYIHKE